MHILRVAVVIGFESRDEAVGGDVIDDRLRIASSWVLEQKDGTRRLPTRTEQE